MDLYNIWLSLVVGANPSNGREIVVANLQPQQLYENRKRWFEYSCFTSRQMEKAMVVTLEMAQDVQRVHHLYNIKSVSYIQSEYPQCMRDIPSSPVVLFYKGDISLLDGQYNVGVVGARNPDRDGVKICEDICKKLSQNGVTIISGLAQGLDGIAHTTALEENANTVAFIGTSLDKYYPCAHRQLQNQICDNGCVVSEYPTGADGYKSVFIERNRLIAAASKAVCIIQAKERSGSLSTAKRADEFSKQIFAVPGNITNPLYDGTNNLIQLGAIPLIKAENVLDYLGIKPKEERNTDKKIKNNLTETEKSIVDSIARQSKSTQQIYQDTKIPMVKLKALLTKLELDGIIVAKSVGVYCKK